MKLLIVGLGSMGKRRARLSKGIDAALHIVGVDTAEARRAEACTLGLADAAYPTIAEAVAAEHPDAALVCTAPLSHAAVIGELLDNDLPVFTELNLVGDGYAENMAKAAAKNLPLFLSSTMLYRRETQYIKQQVQAFGRPVHYIYHIGQYLPDWHPWENYKNFFVGNARTGGVREIFGIDLPWLLDAFGAGLPAPGRPGRRHSFGPAATASPGAGIAPPARPPRPGKSPAPCISAAAHSRTENLAGLRCAAAFVCWLSGT